MRVKKLKYTSILMMLFAVCITAPLLSEAAPMGSGDGSGDGSADNTACDVCETISDVPESVDLDEIKSDCFAFFSSHPEAIDHIGQVYVVPPRNSRVLNMMGNVLSGEVILNQGILVTDGTLVIFPSGIDSISLGRPITANSNRAFFRNEQHNKLRVLPSGSFKIGGGNTGTLKRANALISIQTHIENFYLDGLVLVNKKGENANSNKVKGFIRTASNSEDSSVKNLVIENVDFGNNPANTKKNDSLNLINVTGRVTMNRVTMDCRNLRRGQRCFHLKCGGNCGSSKLSLSNLMLDISTESSFNGGVFGISIDGITHYNIYDVRVTANGPFPDDSHLIQPIVLPPGCCNKNERCVSDVTETMTTLDKVRSAFMQLDNGACYPGSLVYAATVSSTPPYCPLITSVMSQDFILG